MSSEISLRQQIGAVVSEQLLQLLARAYPVRGALPTMKDSDREIGRKIGQIEVVEFLKQCAEDGAL